MPPVCVIKGCETKNNKKAKAANKKVSLFSIPKDNDIYLKWQEAIGRDDLVLKSSIHRVCEKHFLKNEIKREVIHRDNDGNIIAQAFYKTPRLIPGAVPTQRLRGSNSKTNKKENKGKSKLPNYVPNTTCESEIKLEGKCDSSIEIVEEIPTIKYEVNELDLKDDIKLVESKSDIDKIDEPEPDLFKVLVHESQIVKMPDTTWGKHLSVNGGKYIIFSQIVCREENSVLTTLFSKQLIVDEACKVICFGFGIEISSDLIGLTESKITSVSSLETALEKFASLVLCRGAVLASKYEFYYSKNTFVDGLGKFRHINCSIVGTGLCSFCSKIPKCINNKTKHLKKQLFI